MSSRKALALVLVIPLLFIPGCIENTGNGQPRYTYVLDYPLSNETLLFRNGTTRDVTGTLMLNFTVPANVTRLDFHFDYGEVPGQRYGQGGHITIGMYVLHAYPPEQYNTTCDLFHNGRPYGNSTGTCQLNTPPNTRTVEAPDANDASNYQEFRTNGSGLWNLSVYSRGVGIPDVCWYSSWNLTVTMERFNVNVTRGDPGK